MLLPRSAAPLLLLLLLGLRVSLCSGGRVRNRGGGESAGPAAGRAQGPGAPGAPGAAGRGRFTVGGETRCAWTAADDGDAVKLSVRCGDRSCRYAARPRRCPGYLSDPRGFWRQVGRALQKLRGRVCADERALVRAGMCKRAPRDAHFQLDAAGSATPAGPGGPTTPGSPRSASAATPTCSRPDHRRAAEEYCSGPWSSVCAMLFSMVQSDC